MSPERVQEMRAPRGPGTRKWCRDGVTAIFSIQTKEMVIIDASSKRRAIWPIRDIRRARNVNYEQLVSVGCEIANALPTDDDGQSMQTHPTSRIFVYCEKPTIFH